MESFSSHSLCRTCTFQNDCPRPLSVTDRERMFHCNYFIEQNFPKNKALIIKMKINKPKPFLSTTSEATSHLVEEIIKRQEKDTVGMLATYCAACNIEMDKIMTPKHVFYRCPNFPQCDVNAEPNWVSMAVFEDHLEQQEYGDTLSIYDYIDDLNHVLVKFETKRKK